MMKRSICIISSILSSVFMSLVACEPYTSHHERPDMRQDSRSDQDDQDVQDVQSSYDLTTPLIDRAADIGVQLDTSLEPPLDSEPRGDSDDNVEPSDDTSDSGHTSDVSTPEDSNNEVFDSGMTTHMVRWLQDQTDERAAQIGLSLASLARPDLSGGSFGGLVSERDRARHQPVIFVHGNSDRALGGELGGWSVTVDHLRSLGYRSAELYATTYGPARSERALSADYQHTVENVLRVRLLIELTMSYTGARQVNVITHSLGATMTRRALLGGVIEDTRHRVDLGPPLTDSVSTFISIAGAHWGLSGCYLSVSPVCSADLGLYPGQLTPLGVIGRSTTIEALNATRGYEGQRRVSLWSPDDELVGGRCLVWGVNTCQVPDATEDHRLPGLTHLELRDQTVALQAELLTDSH